ncbi:MAG: MaoC family dehydratase [Acidimicrobiaceae bacterium]|nr:MaoC family dehydratase [Acidimicrobiaceae bacterium]
MSQRIHSVNDVRSFTGEHLGFSPYRSVTQSMISTFAEVTGDHQWIHIDEERARSGPFGHTIAHGYLILSMIPALLNEVLIVEQPGTRINYGLNRVRFITPVLEGSDVRLGASVSSVEAAGESWQIVLDVTMEIRDVVKPACVAQVVYRWYGA